MDGGRCESAISIAQPELDKLMPMHLGVSASGHICCCGATLRKLAADTTLIGQYFFDVFEIRRPGGITTLAEVHRRAGNRLYLTLRGPDAVSFRGVAVPQADKRGLLLNLSLGITIVDAVRRHGLTDADFAATDLAVELLYLVEAKTAVMEELRQLNLRLHGAKAAAEEQALTDTLTGLRNRRALDLALEQVIARAAPFGLMHIDLDFFKAVNDTLGHAAGDHVLRHVAAILLAETRINDTVARAGGDEFVIILPGLADKASLLEIAARIIEKLSQPIDFYGEICRISASIGLTISSLYAQPTPGQMLSDADQALYTSKHAGRGTARMTQTAPPERRRKPPRRAG